MLYSYLIDKIKANFPFEPTKDQLKVIELLSEFILTKESKSLMLIKGYAGTGKTSLIASVIKVLNE